MKTWMAALAIALVGIAPAAWPQTHQPYAGLQARPVKALSDQQIADLKAGRGMGLALAAELNGYPGPMHVLELATPLGLSDDQRAKVAALFDAMKQEAVALGERLIAAETALDRQFADKTITASRPGRGDARHRLVAGRTEAGASEVPSGDARAADARAGRALFDPARLWRRPARARTSPLNGLHQLMRKPAVSAWLSVPEASSPS